ncbi:SDR family oxidoreductase [Amycolatopsis thermophila]|uniref:NAD(P)-dependent dehydrogenase (Short-subunit alcohol dehydrogenase family) n=1 Tax=Amycolatopsis thermophila TaxID=206084 RepID=A0ABU0F5G6_9PSEU|nr:SDR family oxidoreductase [Amycolatopsis thermophila]MDQ0382831.1 NAD(P)-dependent dehydrogenase (short-subunit alcohol dehydrogenase family) [Amycolatopsis thermophila]
MRSRRVLVTGCSSGVGRASAIQLAARGHEVIATARRIESIGDLDVAVAVELDVTDADSVAAAADKVGPVDVLVNNAGRGLRAPVELVGDEALRTLWETNVLGPVRTVRAFLPAMRERGAGRIVNVSSVAGRRAMPLTGHYAASKHALEALSESLRFEVRDFGIDVVLVEPGAVKSDFSAKRLAADVAPGPYAEVAARATAQAAANAPAQTSEEVAEVVVRAVEAERVPLRMPTSEAVAGMIRERTGRTDDDFEEWATRG